MSDKRPKEKKIPSPKPTNAEFEERVNVVLELLMEGRPRSYIQQYAAKEWGVSERPIDNLIAKAKDTLKEINAATRIESQELVLSNFWDLYREAKKKKDPYLALSILKEIARVKGLNEQHVLHTIDDKRDLINITDSEMESALEQQVNYFNGKH